MCLLLPIQLPFGFFKEVTQMFGKFSLSLLLDLLFSNLFLEANGVSLHLKEKKLQIAGEAIPMSLGAGSPLVNEKEMGVSLAICRTPQTPVSPVLLDLLQLVTACLVPLLGP
jgi:hypothetical protein